MNFTQKEIKLAGIITIIGIIIISAVFLIVYIKKTGEEKNKKSIEIMEEIKQKSYNQEKEGEEASKDTKEEDQKTADIKTYNGFLITSNENTIVVKEETSGNEINFFIDEKTKISYNEKTFYKQDFYPGDMMTIQATKNKNNEWVALVIDLQFSASPKMPAPVPKGLIELPSGELKPLGGE